MSRKGRRTYADPTGVEIARLIDYAEHLLRNEIARFVADGKVPSWLHFCSSTGRDGTPTLECDRQHLALWRDSERRDSPERRAVAAWAAKCYEQGGVLGAGPMPTTTWVQISWTRARRELEQRASRRDQLDLFAAVGS